jgi:hypothetical protein
MSDPIQVASDHYTVVEENARVRILEFIGKRGDKTPMHSHPATVAISISPIRERMMMPNGETMEVEMPAGASMYVDGIEHGTEVLGDTSHMFLIELKGNEVGGTSASD